jgi:hypothetical protein
MPISGPAIAAAYHPVNAACMRARASSSNCTASTFCKLCLSHTLNPKPWTTGSPQVLLSLLHITPPLLPVCALGLPPRAALHQPSPQNTLTPRCPSHLRSCYCCCMALHHCCLYVAGASSSNCTATTLPTEHPSTRYPETQKPSPPQSLYSCCISFRHCCLHAH